MRYRRKNRGFEPAARLPVNGRGLPAARARQLILSAAWREVAGPTLTPLVAALDVRRGVLEIEVGTADVSWLPTLAEVLPELAARIAARAAGLSISRYRIHGLGSDHPPTVRRLPALEPSPDDCRTGRQQDGSDRAGEKQPEPVQERLEAAMEAYLKRGPASRAR